jgi:hypothetical protein
MAENTEDQVARLECYVERYHERSGRSAFPTVRECAKTLALSQEHIARLAEEHEALRLTAYVTQRLAPLGHCAVENTSAAGLRAHLTRRAYGVTEVAAAVGELPGTIHVWLHRGAHGIPEPDERLASGPVWLGGGPITPWILQRRAGGAA